MYLFLSWWYTMRWLWTAGIIGALACEVCPLLIYLLKLISNTVLYWWLGGWARAVEVCIGHVVCQLLGGASGVTRRLPLSQVLHELQPLVLLVYVDLLVKQLCRIFVLFLVNAFALSVQALLILPLLVVDVLLEAIVHLESGVKSIFDGVVRPACHVLGDQWPLLAVLEVQAHQLLIFV